MMMISVPELRTNKQIYVLSIFIHAYRKVSMHIRNLQFCNESFEEEIGNNPFLP